MKQYSQFKTFRTVMKRITKDARDAPGASMMYDVQ